MHTHEELWGRGALLIMIAIYNKCALTECDTFGVQLQNCSNVSYKFSLNKIKGDIFFKLRYKEFSL